ncbi:uncharacterized protein FPRO_03864 [Fusarium proliferatum ET1]|uniref:Uncharacterized protein n=1 Tax=Fusarium proliferatum (strain ET1) TaxID=1227346 RepID=A0A1L7W8A2_FUSPR|nr:uncharacterized protein FPRO_03864 [Fusarium proliferatum ET1]CZR48815.1 uncharacterized protein FPRO_03864 [Fusarium proliferatum ET1]
MANPQFYYFYAPTWDYPPEGPIKLGNVITSIKKPHISLANIVPSQDIGVFKTEKKSVQYTQEKLISGSFSILTRFLSILGFGVDVSAEVRKSNKESFIFDTLETTQFIPTPGYLQQCLDRESVRRWLELSNYRKPIYIITGLKVVTGAEANTIRSRTVGGIVSAEVDGTVWSGGTASIGIGPGIEGEVGEKRETRWADGNFVFAFRVSKIHIKKTGDIIKEEEFTRGAFLDCNDLKPREGTPNIISIVDMDIESEGFYREVLVEGGEKVFIAILRK